MMLSRAALVPCIYVALFVQTSGDTGRTAATTHLMGFPLVVALPVDPLWFAHGATGVRESVDLVLRFAVQ